MRVLHDSPLNVTTKTANSLLLLYLTYGKEAKGFSNKQNTNIAFRSSKRLNEQTAYKKNTHIKHNTTQDKPFMTVVVTTHR